MVDFLRFFFAQLKWSGRIYNTIMAVSGLKYDILMTIFSYFEVVKFQRI